MRGHQAGRLYELPLLFVGSTILLALLLPPAMKSGHSVLAWAILGSYGAIQIFLLCFVGGWARIVAILVIALEAIVRPWVPPDVQKLIVLSMPVLFVLGWGVDAWRRRVSNAKPPKAS